MVFQQLQYSSTVDYSEYHIYKLKYHQLPLLDIDLFRKGVLAYDTTLVRWIEVQGLFHVLLLFTEMVSCLIRSYSRLFSLLYQEHKNLLNLFILLIYIKLMALNRMISYIVLINKVSNFP